MEYLRNLFPTISMWLIIFIFLTQSGISEALFESCDSNYNIKSGYTYLESPYYPNDYTSGTSCRYRFTAPLDYDIQIDCAIDLQKNPSACSTEYFYVATDGDTQLRGSEQFCGQGSIKRRSNFRSISLAYISNGGHGSFQCKLFAAPQSCDCGWSASTKIVNGQPASINEYPSIVGLHDRTSNIDVFCGGAIINHYYIVTAAHCTRRVSVASNIEARVGDITAKGTSSNNAATYQIKRIIEHPNYTANPVRNDIALLQTTQPIEWSRSVGPICLPPVAQFSNNFAYSYVDLLGWGTTSFGGPTSNSLQKVTLQVVENSACAESYQRIAPIYASQMCSYDYTGNSRDSCQYDSGGPAIKRGTRQFLLGIISFGKVCGGDRYAVGVNTRITSYLRWIYQYVYVCYKKM